MKVKRWNWIFSPLILLFFLGCKSDDKPDADHPVAKRYLEDYERPASQWGFIDTQGNIAIEAKFDDVRAFHQGWAPAQLNGLWGYIDKSGDWIISPNFIKAQPIENGVGRVRFTNGLMGLINTQKDTLIQPQFDDISAQQDNLFVTRLRNKKGIIVSEGNVIVDNVYDDIKILFPNLFGLKYRQHFHLINSKFDTVSQDILSIKKGGIIKTEIGWGVVDSNGKWLVEPNEQIIQAGQPGYFIIKKHQAVDLLDATTNRTTAIDALDVKYLGEERYAKKTYAGWQLINSEGTIISSQHYDSIYEYAEGVAAYELNDWWGYFDKNGEHITDPIFALPWQSAEGKIRFFTGSGFGFHDQMGKLVIEPKFNDVRDFSEGLAAYMD